MPSAVYQGAPSTYPGGFPAGVSIRGMPLVFPNAQGQVFYVNNSTSLVGTGQKGGSDNNRGTYNAPFSTLSKALTACTAGNQDIIFLGPGHAETISTATALNINKAGVTIIGIGTGDARPTITLSTANTATITVSAANVTIVNTVFVANFLNIAALFTLTTAKGFTLESCNIRDTSAILNFLDCIRTSATSNANDGLVVSNNDFHLKAASGAVRMVSFLGTHDRVKIVDNYYQSDTVGTGAVFPIATGKVITGLQLRRNRFVLVQTNLTTTGYLITTDGSTNSGMIDENRDHTLAHGTLASSLMVTASSGFKFGRNMHCQAVDKSGADWPAVTS